jgi:hypothetical protein
MADTKANSRARAAYRCRQRKYFEKLDLLLFGNGHPEDGIVFKLLAVIDGQKEIKSSLTDINKGISDLNLNHNTLLTEIVTTNKNLNDFKDQVAKEKAAEIEAKKEAEKLQDKSEVRQDKDRQDKRGRRGIILQALSVIAMFLALGVSIFFQWRNDKRKWDEIREDLKNSKELPAGEKLTAGSNCLYFFSDLHAGKIDSL